MVTGHGSIWVVGCGQRIDVNCVWCVAGNSGFSIFFHSDSVSQIGIGFWFDLERDLSDSLKASQCRVKHKATVAFKVVAAETNGREKKKVRMSENVKE